MILPTAHPHCVLRPWRDGDQPSLVHHANNHRVWRNLTHTFPHPYTLADAQQWLTLSGADPHSLHLAIEHEGQAGDRLDAARWRETLAQSLAVSEVAVVRRGGVLVGYAMLQPRAEPGLWFVTGFNTHPAHRHGVVVRALLQQLLAIAQRRGIVTLQSHVYKTNRLSMAFHARLGFAITRENDKGVEFTASVAELVAAAAGKMGASLPARCP